MSEEAISFADDIAPLFTAIDHDHMSWFCDLFKYDDVKANATEILDRLKGIGGSVMPPPPNRGGNGPWPPERIALFAAWIDAGHPA